MKPTRVGLMIGLTGLSTVALALPSFVKVFDTTYSIKKDSALGKASCAVCHIGKTMKLNPYGTDMKKVLSEAKTKALSESILKKLDSLDSDKDGVTNKKEIQADTLPGDPKSVKK